MFPSLHSSFRPFTPSIVAQLFLSVSPVWSLVTFVFCSHSAVGHTHTHTHTHTESYIRAVELKKRFLKRERFSRKVSGCGIFNPLHCQRMCAADVDLFAIQSRRQVTPTTNVPFLELCFFCAFMSSYNSNRLFNVYFTETATNV